MKKNHFRQKSTFTVHARPRAPYAPPFLPITLLLPTNHLPQSLPFNPSLQKNQLTLRETPARAHGFPAAQFAISSSPMHLYTILRLDPLRSQMPAYPQARPPTRPPTRFPLSQSAAHTAHSPTRNLHRRPHAPASRPRRLSPFQPRLNFPRPSNGLEY